MCSVVVQMCVFYPDTSRKQLYVTGYKISSKRTVRVDTAAEARADGVFLWATSIEGKNNLGHVENMSLISSENDQSKVSTRSVHSKPHSI